jgi:hypothetical protein
LKPIMLVLLAMSTVSVSVVGCSRTHNQAQGYAPTGWHKVDAESFSVFTPMGWEFRNVQSVDSYMGRFEGDGVVLSFDFGRFTNSLDDSRGPAYLITDEYIGGFRAKLGRPRTPGQGLTAIYFPKFRGSDSLFLYGRDLTATQQELVLKIFRTIRLRDADLPHGDSRNSGR